MNNILRKIPGGGKIEKLKRDEENNYKQASNYQWLGWDQNKRFWYSFPLYKNWIQYKKMNALENNNCFYLSHLIWLQCKIERMFVCSSIEASWTKVLRYKHHAPFQRTQSVFCFCFRSIVWLLWSRYLN